MPRDSHEEKPSIPEYERKKFLPGLTSVALRRRAPGRLPCHTHTHTHANAYAHTQKERQCTDRTAVIWRCLGAVLKNAVCMYASDERLKLVLR